MDFVPRQGGQVHPEVLRLRAKQQSLSRPVASPAGGSRYGRLYAPPPTDLPELRRQQAQFKQTTDEFTRRNWWFAIPALAPVAAVLGLEAAALFGARALGPQGSRAAFDFVEREIFREIERRVGRSLTDAEKTRLRELGRKRIAQSDGMAARDLQAKVHHRQPLEWAHLTPGANPNRLANLQPLRREAHDIATNEWAKFKRSLGGREPTPAEMMRETLRIDKLISTYIRRPGVPRTNKPSGKGKGPLR